jgi:hypothetical protein
VTPSFAAMPDPGTARTLDELIECLRALKVWAGDPSYEMITDRINAAWTAAGRPSRELARRGTVVGCFRPGRRRVNTDLFVAAVRALHPDEGYVAQWVQALRVVLGETQAAAQVRAQDTLPADLADFIGRRSELDLLRLVLGRSRTENTVVISGMAGVGKTQLAVHAGYLLAGKRRCGRGNHPAASGAPLHSATPTTVPTSAGVVASGPPLRSIDPCDLATREEFAAALGTRIKQPKRAGSSDSDVTCVVESAASSSAITLSILRPDEGAQTYLEVNRTAQTRPLPGLGDDAFVGNYALGGQDQQFRNVVVYVRKGDLVVLVNGDPPAGAAAGTDPAFGTRLATLAGQVLASLQRHRA